MSGRKAPIDPWVRAALIRDLRLSLQRLEAMPLPPASTAEFRDRRALLARDTRLAIAQLSSAHARSTLAAAAALRDRESPA